MSVDNMDRFCIIVNVEKDQDFHITNQIKKYLKKHNKIYYLAVNEISANYREQGFISPSELPQDIQCAIILGGDGTMILAANELVHRNIPIIGVNLGTLGFLTEIEKENIYDTLDALIADKYQIEARMMIEGTLYNRTGSGYTGLALNDIVINRRDSSGLITTKILINGEHVNTYTGDGVIVSTPTGSTGYNLSAGGPTAMPNSKIMIITPICPHTFNNRSMVVTSQDRIEIEICDQKRKNEVVATFDGKERIELAAGDKIEIYKSIRETQLVRVKKSSFFDLLRTKIGEV